MFRAALVLAAAPVAMIATLNATKPPPPEPVVMAPVVAQDPVPGSSFEQRWQPVIGGVRRAPPPIEVRDDARRNDIVAGEVEPDVIPARSHRRHRVRHAKPARDLCARHGMRKVYTTRKSGWKSWRCRR